MCSLWASQFLVCPGLIGGTELISPYFGKVLVALAAAVSITATSFSPAQAAETVPIPVGSTSPCQDVVVIGAKGSGQTLADNKGFGPEAWLGLTTYAGHMDGYKVGYYSVPYAAAPADVERGRYSPGSSEYAV